MDVEKIKQLIRTAHEAVKDESEPYKLEAFKIILTKLLNDNFETMQSHKKTLHTQSTNQSEDGSDSNPIQKLAKICSVSDEQMRNVLDYENGKFIILKKVEGATTAEKQINASLCILTAWAKGMNQSWIGTVTLGDSLRELSIDTAHLGENITKTEYFSLKGKRKGAKYHITTQGWQEGLDLLKSLAGV